MLSSFKGYSEAPNQVVFPTAVLYHKEQPTATGAAAGNNSVYSPPGGTTVGSSSSSLSAGAIAGIAVGAAAGAAALAGFTWLLLQQRQRRRQQSPGKAANEAGHSSSKLANGDSYSSPGAMRRHSPGSLGHGSNSGSRRQSSSAAHSAEAIPELVNHAAAREAALMAQGAMSPQHSGQWEDSLLLLPPHLRPWVVDASQITYLQRLDGKLWQIGSGASSKVYRVEYRGEVRPAVLCCAVLCCAVLCCAVLCCTAGGSKGGVCSTAACGKPSAGGGPAVGLPCAVLPMPRRCWLPRKWSWGPASHCGKHS